MAASAETEPKRSMLLLKDVRFLYGRYQRFFRPIPASGKTLARTLSILNDGINRFIKYNAGSGPLSVFRQLTLGLSETLVALQLGLRSCAGEYESDTLDASDWPFELDSESMEHFQARLHPISMSVDIINEAMEMAMIERSGVRSSETLEEICKRIDEANNSPARLSTLLHNFVHGITSQLKLETPDGRELHTFASANISHGEVGQSIAAKLKQETQEAVRSKEDDEARLAWMIRHSIYWFSKSSEDLREWRSENGLTISNRAITASDQEWHIIAKVFLDAIKAAWLLEDLGDLRAYGEPSAEVREVVACAKKKVLSLLQSFYKDIFTVPNYDLINQLGNFGMCTDDERKEEAPQSSESYVNLSPSVSTSS